MTTWLRGFGLLRLLLLGSVAALILFGPFSGGPVRLEGIALFTTLLAPVGFALFVFVLPLDMLMTLVFMSGADEGRRALLRRVLLTEAALLVLLVLAWAGFVARLLERP